MPAEIENTASFVNIRFMPTVAHAAGESFIASSRRPNGPRRSQATKIAITANVVASSISCRYSVSNA